MFGVGDLFEVERVSVREGNWEVGRGPFTFTQYNIPHSCVHSKASPATPITCLSQGKIRK